MKIGHVTLDNTLVLAPMAGVCDVVFRGLVKEMGCGLVYTEMISDKALIYGNRETFKMLNIRKEERPVSVQIFGSEPGAMAQAARIVQDRGADIIDINMGCPTPKIVRNGEGAALMKNPDLAGAIVEAVASEVKVPVTVKMRKGWDEASVNAVEIAMIVERSGAKAIAIHGRTRDQFYGGNADWNIIHRVKEAVSVPVIGNGDVRSAVDVERMLAATGCDAVMIGRGALGYPWIFKEVLHYLATGEVLPPPAVRERMETAIRHLGELVRLKGEYIAVREMRKHAAWYIRGMRKAARVREAINKAATQEEMVWILSELARSL